MPDRPLTEIHDWLDRLYGRSPGFFTVCLFGGGKIRPTEWFRTDEIERAAAFIEKSRDSLDIYTSVATHAEVQPKGRGNANTVLSIPGFWADLDYGTDGHNEDVSPPNPADEAQALSLIEGMPEPSALVHSGGGLQAYWFFDEPWVIGDDRDLAVAASSAWQAWLIECGAARGFHVDNVGDLARIMRVPGTFNRKLPERPRLAETRYLDRPTYPAVELGSLGPAERVQDADTAPKDIGTPDGTWGEILRPHGWTEVGIRATDGAAYWRRPGKSEGHSAMTDPLDIPVLVNYSSSVDLPSGPGHKLTKRKVWEHLNFGGDEKAARSARDGLRGPPEGEGFAPYIIDWVKEYNEVPIDPDFLIYPFIERGGQMALYSEGKVGKSLAFLDFSQAAVRGVAFANNPARMPITILYVDMENNKQVFIERLRDKMRVDPHSLVRLVYVSFPMMPDLDTPEGGRLVLREAQKYAADLVIIDTVARVIGGDENDNDTYNKFYKSTGLPLKGAGIAVIRLDHSGKDKTKGMRGASSESTDVDDVWHMTDGGDSDPDRLTFERTHSRMHHGPDRLVMMRRDSPLRHEAVTDDGGGSRDALRRQADGLLFITQMTTQGLADEIAGSDPDPEKHYNKVRAMLNRARKSGAYEFDRSTKPGTWRRVE